MTNIVSPTQNIIKAIEVMIKEISALPSVNEATTNKPRQMAQAVRAGRPTPALAVGWGILRPLSSPTTKRLSKTVKHKPPPSLPPSKSNTL
jgi:hypothetical protein